jgi:2-oxoglutarate ferredoxin oxidoreductase subunit alpha
MAELPLVLVVSQRTGPSTGLPTYTGQSDLQFILHAGQGEYPRLIIAPGDAQEALYWSAAAMTLAWRYQVPAFILADKTLSEGTYSVDAAVMEQIRKTEFSPSVHPVPYRRYSDSPTGISPLAFPGMKDTVVKVNSYAHDESGFTTEEASVVGQMTKKRLCKWEGLAEEILKYPSVVTSGTKDSPVALLCWGSTHGVCDETALMQGLRVVRPIVLSPFPVAQMKNALAGAERLIAIEENATAQLASLARCHGIDVQEKILQFDGRPFTADDLTEQVKRVIV